MLKLKVSAEHSEQHDGYSERAVVSNFPALDQWYVRLTDMSHTARSARFTAN